MAAPGLSEVVVKGLRSCRRQRSCVHDLRGSAVVRLALAEATVPQIATFTGHSLKEVEAILDAHYLDPIPPAAARAYDTPRSLTSLTASSLNSRVNFRLSITHLLLHKTPNSVSSEPGAAQLG